MTSYLGGTRIVFVSWQGASTIRVDFVSIYSGKLYQLYAGRTLLGETTTTGEKHILATMTPTLWPEWLQVVAIDPELKGTDLGLQLPPRPYNKARIALDTTGWPDDAKAIEVISGTEPGGAVSTDNVVAHQLVINPDGPYTITTTPIGPSGQWNFEAYGIDDKPTDGNPGEPLELSCDLLTMPRDFDPQDDGTRFAVTADAGVMTLNYNFAG